VKFGKQRQGGINKSEGSVFPVKKIFCDLFYAINLESCRLFFM
jgi:hypothetical protein